MLRVLFVQARSYVQARGGSCLLVPCHLNFFDQLILRKIIKIVATRRQILTLKYTEIDFGWGSAPDPAGGAYSASPDPLAGFKGPTSKGRGGDGREREGRRGGEGRTGKGGDGRGRGAQPVCLLVLTILATGLLSSSRLLLI